MLRPMTMGVNTNIYLLSPTAAANPVIRVTKQDGHAIGIGLAFKRELAVFLRGYGLGIPIVYLFTMGTAYKTLTSKGIASWDQDYSLLVRQRHNSVIQTLVGGIAVAALVAGLVALSMPS